MNGTVAKATARDIRRAFGDDVLKTIEAQGDVLQSVVLPRLMVCGQTFETMDRRLEALETTQARHAAVVAAWPTTFYGRLRLLVTGR